jgi:hypothetical protein
MIKKINALIAALIGAMFFRPKDYQTAPASGYTIAQMGATAMQAIFQDRNLREEATLDDFWNRMSNVVKINNNEIEIGDQPFLKIPTPPQGTFKMVLGITSPLKKAFAEGSDETILGAGEQLTLAHMPVYFNEIKKSVAYRGWGIEYEQLAATGLYKTINPKFEKAWREYRGLRIRKASMLTFEDALCKSPHDTTNYQQFNCNIFIPNLDLADMPVWDITALTNTAGTVDSLGFYPDRVFSGVGTYVESIAAKMLEASGTGETPQAYIDIPNLDDLDLWLRTRIQMQPARIGAKYGYAFVCPTNVVFYLTSAVRTNSPGALWVTTHTSLTAEEMAYPGMMFKYKSLWVIEDERGPTLTVSGAEGTYTLQPGFMNPGNNDDRNQDAWGSVSGTLNYVFDVCFVYGAGALAEWIIYDPKYATESTEFGQFLEKGSYMLGGIQLVRYDQDTPTDSTTTGKSMIQKNCAMVLCSRVASAATIRATS